MNSAKEDSLIILDSITDIATQHNIPNLWNDLIGFLRGFQRIAKKKNITIYLLLNKGVLETAKELELADMADAVLLFKWEESTGARRQRVMYFEKFRGVMPHLEERDLVKFSVRISTAGGFEVSNIRVIYMSAARVRVGIPGLDDMLGGGLVPGSICAIVGSYGTGKTTFSLEFVWEGLQKGENIIYISLEEQKDRILNYMQMKGWDIQNT